MDSEESYEAFKQNCHNVPSGCTIIFGQGRSSDVLRPPHSKHDDVQTRSSRVKNEQVNVRITLTNDLQQHLQALTRLHAARIFWIYEIFDRRMDRLILCLVVFLSLSVSSHLFCSASSRIEQLLGGELSGVCGDLLEIARDQYLPPRCPIGKGV